MFSFTSQCSWDKCRACRAWTARCSVTVWGRRWRSVEAHTFMSTLIHPTPTASHVWPPWGGLEVEGFGCLCLHAVNVWLGERGWCALTPCSKHGISKL